MSRSDKLIEMSTTLPLEEVLDTRNESSVPELQRVAELRDSGSVADAINYSMSLQKMYPDFDLIPFMIAYIQYQEGNPDKALKTALAAIPDVKRKYRLYSVAGLAEYGKSNLTNAIVWWSRSAIAQASVTDFQEYDPFLYLGYAAQAVGENAHAETLFTLVNAIDPSAPRSDGLKDEMAAELKGSWAKKPVSKILEIIIRKYLS